MKKERKLDRLYAEFDKEYSGKSEEEMEKIISDLEKEIVGKESSLEGLEDGEKKENLQKDIEQGKKRLENLKGYSKNKTQIEGIRKYRDSLVAKLEQEKVIKSESCELKKKAEEDLIKVSKKLADEKYTMTLDQDGYNALLEEKARTEKVMKEQSARYMKSSKRIVELQSKIGKCNLAWKSLFVNKSWDDIHRIALEPDTRFTRKINPEKDTRISAKKIETSVDKEQAKIQEQIAESVQRIQAEEKPIHTETKALVEKKEGFFKKLWNGLKNWINGDKKQEKATKNNDEKKGNEQDQKPIEEKKQEEKVVEEKTNTKAERDAFLEGLRQHVDVEYRKSVREGKEEQYIENHKVQPKQEEKEAKEELEK